MPDVRSPLAPSSEGSERADKVRKVRQVRPGAADLKAQDVEQYLIRANMHRARGRYDLAFQELERAVELAPDCADVYEMMGDILRARAEPERAFEKYQKALEIDPSRPSVEEKLAVVSLDIAEIARRRQERVQIAENPQLKPKGKKPEFAATLSLLIPGGGQFYNEDWVKGGVVIAIFVPTLLLFLNEVFSILGQAAHLRVSIGELIESMIKSMRGWSTIRLLLILVCGLISFAAWTYSIADAYISANRLNKEIAKELGIE